MPYHLPRDPHLNAETGPRSLPAVSGLVALQGLGLERSNPFDRGSRRQGVTLFELLVVILVMSILAATMVPLFSGTLATVRLQTSAREILNTLQLVSEQAVASGQPHRVRFDVASGRFWVEWISPDEPSAFVPRRDFNFAAEAGHDDGQLPQQLSLSLHTDASLQGWELFGGKAPTSVDSVAFFPDGSAERAQLLLRDDSTQIEIRVDPLTARVHVMSTGGAS